MILLYKGQINDTLYAQWNLFNGEAQVELSNGEAHAELLNISCSPSKCHIRSF